MKQWSITLLGAGYRTGNMGVAALATGTVTSILSSFPDAKITLVDYSPSAESYSLNLGSKAAQVRLFPIRFLRGFLPLNNVFLLIALATLARIFAPLRSWLAARVPAYMALRSADAVLCLNGGDSFSDIYGLVRLIYVSAPAFLAIAIGKPLIFLPQTYGPFSSIPGKAIAALIMRLSSRLYSRDREGHHQVRQLQPRLEPPTFAYDMAFGLNPVAPPEIVTSQIRSFASNAPLIGINLSGLLASGGYNRQNMFNLGADYLQTLAAIVSDLSTFTAHKFLLIPHVLGTNPLDNDLVAINQFYESLPEHIQSRTLRLSSDLSESELKYVIGLCDFFVGSRMHACIAALSQGIPAIGLAYSKKFRGVFASINAQELSLDLRSESADALSSEVLRLFKQRSTLRDNLLMALRSVYSSIAPFIRDIHQTSMAADAGKSVTPAVGTHLRQTHPPTGI